MSEDERVELEELRREMQLNSLGDRPQSMAAFKLRRLIQLEATEQEVRLPFCWVCRENHHLTADQCPAMWDIA